MRRLARLARWVGVSLGLFACASSAEVPEVSLHRDGIEVEAVSGVRAVEVIDPDGMPLARQRTPEPVDQAEVRVPWRHGGPHRVRIETGSGRYEQVVQVPDVLPALEVRLEAPVGQGRHLVSDGDDVRMDRVGRAPVQIAVVARAWAAGTLTIDVAGDVRAEPVLPGGRVAHLATVARTTPVVVRLGPEQVRFRIVTVDVPVDRARSRIALTSVRFPASPAGVADVARPPGRVTLPSRWWGATLGALGLGFRPHDRWSPWAWLGVELDNRSDAAVNVAVRARVLGPDGAPAAEFRPALREGNDGSGMVRILLRVPPHQTVVGALPVFVDEAALDPDAGPWTRVVEVTPLGSSEPLWVDEAPLYVSRGSSTASLGLLLTLVGAALGTAMVAILGPRWLRRAPTSELMTISAFAALTFLVSVAGTLLAYGVGALLGPFATLVTGLADDALRYALLATLVTLLPRPGTVTLAVVVSFLLSGVALGSFAPTDLLFVGSRVLWLEGALWLTGVTRATGWVDEPAWRRFGRLGAGFGLASVVTNATGLVLHVVLYRLFFAAWFVALVLALPGFLYVLIAVAVAVPFAASLRSIQR